MRTRPYEFIFWTLIYTVLVFSYSIRVCELPLSRDNPEPNDFRHYLNAVWCIMVTVTNIGQGDVWVKTIYGRIYILTVAVIGLFIVSLMVATLMNLLLLSSGEARANVVLEKLELRDKINR